MSENPEEDKLLQKNIMLKAKELISLLETGDLSQARCLINTLNEMREDSLYLEIGKLTRELHETIKDIDVGLSNKEMPKAKNKLNNVIELCEMAANKTLDGIEDTIPMSDALAKEAKQLAEQWGRFARRELTVEEFNNLYVEMMKYLENVEISATNIHGNLQEVLLAQNYQDLTGQAIKKVIDTVSSLEKRLVQLVKIAAEANKSFAHQVDVNLLTDEEVSSNIIEQNNKEVSGQDEVDDLLSSLGF